MANVKDGATSTVLTAPSPATSGLSLGVNTGEAARYPTPPFYAIAHPNNTIPTVSIAEKILVTAIVGDTLTIVRAQGIYTAKSIAVGWRISNAIFQEDMNNSSIIQNEVPGGSVNGSNTAFTIASATGRVTGSLRVYQNGIRLKNGGNDFTETSTGFTMTTAPATGDTLLVDYNINGALNNVGTNSNLTSEIPTGLVNSSNTAYTTARAYIAGSLEVYVAGLKKIRGTDYTETTPGTGAFTMTVAPTTGNSISVNYQFNLNPASNADTTDGIHATSTTGSEGQLLADYSGWNLTPGTMTYLSASTFTTPSDFTPYMGIGDKIRYKQGGSFKYAYIVGLSSTVMTISVSTDYTLANAAVTDFYVSHVSSPAGFPQWFNWTPVVNGTSGSVGTYAATVYTARYSIQSRNLSYKLAIDVSNKGSWSGNVQVSLPVSPQGASVDFIYTSGFITNIGDLVSALKGLATVEKVAGLIDFGKAVGTTNTTWADVTATFRITSAATYEI